MQKLWKSIKIWQRYKQLKGGNFFETHCRSKVDIQSVTAEIRRGKKKKKERMIETTGQKYNALPYSIGRP